MSDLHEMINVFAALGAEHKPAALARVIRVRGSAYRRPGARMLIAGDGRTWGGVSGGCLERDVARRGRAVIDTGRCITRRYETTDDDDPRDGVATGCNGVIDIFIEPLSRSAPGIFPALMQVLHQRRSITIATVIHAPAASNLRPASRLMLDSAGTIHSNIESAEARAAMLDLLQTRDDHGRPSLVRLALTQGDAEVFIERVLPSQSLVIFGDGPDVVPLLNMAKMLGWHVTVASPRPIAAMRERFAQADRLCVCPCDHPAAGVPLDPDAAIVLMTHNYPRDFRILASLRFQPRYLGILGPKLRTHRLLAELPAECCVLKNIHAPIGLDLAAQTPEEIAVAIIAEIQAVIRAASAGFLRDRPGPIHDPSAAQASEPILASSPARGPACPA